jgi:hypothetical protein
MNMRARFLTAALASTLALAACGGGGSTNAGGPAVPAAVATVAPTAAPPGAAAIPMTISIPHAAPSAAARSARFFSPSTGALAIYDGPTLIYVANLALDSTPPFTTIYAKPASSTTVAFGSCTFSNSTATCTLTLTSTIGPHKFDVIAYPSVLRPQADTSTPPAFTGVISSEGELSVTLSPGANPAQTLTMLGVASKVIIAGAQSGPYNQATQFGYRIQDSTSAQIVAPGSAYDNGPVTITAAPAGIVTIAPNSIATPPTSAGDQNFNVTCVNTSGGSVTISFNARTTPNTAYASALTYTSSNYSGAVIATTSFSCDPSSATIPITVQ